MDSILLDDSRMQSFIADGYTVVKTDLPADFHQSIYGQIEEVLTAEGNPGNNLLPRIPDLQQVFDQPQVAGALTSILGPGYYLHPHRFCHFNKPGSEGQGLHKDSWSRRHHRLRWAMAFYYPQDTPVERGPTGVVPAATTTTASTKGMRSEKSRLLGRPGRSPLSTTICGTGPPPIAPSRIAIWSSSSSSASKSRTGLVGTQLENLGLGTDMPRHRCGTVCGNGTAAVRRPCR